MNNALSNDIYIKDYALLVALMISIQFINSVIIEIIGIEMSVMPALFILLFLYYTFITFKLGNLRIKLIYMLLGLLMSTYYFISYILYSEVISVSITFFLGFCVMPYLFMNKQVESKLVITYVVKISVIAIPVSGKIFNYSQSGINYNSISMGMSYAILPVIIASFVHFIYYRKSATIWIKISYIANIYYTIQLIFLGNRGVILSLLCALLLVLLIRFDKSGRRITKNINLYITKLIIMLILLAIIIINFRYLLILIHDLLGKFGLDLAFLSKTSLLLASNNVDNGRIELILLGIKGFIESPIWGNGIGVFGANNGTLISYPHNLFVQLLYDGGLILFIPIMYLFFSCTIRIFRTTNLIQGYPLFILLFSTSIPRLMVSADIWKVQSYWMLLGFLIVNFSSYKYLNSEKIKKNKI